MTKKNIPEINKKLPPLTAINNTKQKNKFTIFSLLYQIKSLLQIDISEVEKISIYLISKSR